MIVNYNVLLEIILEFRNDKNKTESEGRIVGRRRLN